MLFYATSVEPEPRWRPSPLQGAVVVAGVFYLVGQYIASQPQRVAEETEAKREITVQGIGEVRAKPDVARLALGVQTGVQPTAKAALDMLSRKFEAVVAAVKSSGVNDEDLRATNLSLNPLYDYPDGRQVLRGFEASESIEVTIRDLEKIGEVLARTTAEGVNQSGSLSFEIDEPEALRGEAEEKAIKDATGHAQRLARALGVSLGRVKTFSVTPSPGIPPIYAEARLEAGSAPAGPPVPSGTQEISVTVTVTYELR